ncbi:LLM class flavin-dependent oxidoreductase [Brevibacillus sp. NRS-1366]|uniref:LLM class flavin-dependent oxidoreductase n=1 Tax=Brevibacillus sp. NRS-1366 TaxID=3233899 RepID=UPI003D1B6CF2
MSNLDVFREAGNPMFNENKLKLGTFASNCSGALSMTLAETVFEPTFEKNVEIAKMAEAAGFECMIPLGRWRGWGGPSNFNGTSMEVYTWAAALAAVTEKICLFATSHVGTVHPLLAAKQAATIDHVSKGRFGLNIVTGNYREEMEMFGPKMMDHDRRYDYAGEWIEVVLKFWTEQYFDHAGEFFTINDGFLMPKPYQNPRPVLISAGTSPKGREFATKNCDINFGPSESMEKLTNWTREIKGFAWENYRREIGTFTACMVVCRDTEKEAKEYYDYYVHEKGDWEAAGNAIKTMMGESKSFSMEFLQKFQERFVAGVGYPLIGTPEQITEKLIELSATGVDGTLLNMVDYNVELPHWNEKVMPLLEQAGLRKPVKKNEPQSV